MLSPCAYFFLYYTCMHLIRILCYSPFRIIPCRPSFWLCLGSWFSTTIFRSRFESYSWLWIMDDLCRDVEMILIVVRCRGLSKVVIWWGRLLPSQFLVGSRSNQLRTCTWELNPLPPPPAQPVSPSVWYGTICGLIKIALGSVPCSMVWRRVHWVLVNCMVQEGPLWRNPRIQEGPLWEILAMHDILSGINLCKVM
jgi:hypothetical protein